MRSARDYMSLRVKPGPAPLPRDAIEAGALSLAVVTLATSTAAVKARSKVRTSALSKARGQELESMGAPPESALCALVQWCERAALFARALRSGKPSWNVTMLVLGESPAVLDNCPAAATFLPLDPAVTGAMSACERASPGHPVATDVNLYKWGVLQLTQYSLVLFADADVDLMPTEDFATTAARWATIGRRVAEAGKRGDAAWPSFVSNGDTMTPVNGGLWVVRPSLATHQDGLAVLSRCRWNVSHGWEYAGPPWSLGLVPRHPDGERVSRDIADGPTMNNAYSRNSWGFVSGARNQGFLWYFFYVRQPAGGAYFRFSSNKHRATHWRGRPKPWQVPQPRDAQGMTNASLLANVPPWRVARSYAYLTRARLLDGGSTKASRCIQTLWSYRRAIEDTEGFLDLPSERIGSGNVPMFPMW